jgi:hypothetical protein
LEDTIWILDESHEVSTEINMLFQTLFAHAPCVLLTATPKQWMFDRKWEFVRARAPPLHEIWDKKMKIKLDEAIVQALKAVGPDGGPKFKRILVIHPSSKKAQEYALKYKESGFHALWAEDRNVPPTGHIIATQIADAGLTIPGCDLVIDSGMRVVNDKGQTKSVPVDKATSLQRRGRTGRTCPGEYWLLGDIVDADYEPAPDIVSVLSHSPLAIHFKTEVALELCEPQMVEGDRSGRRKPIADIPLATSHSFYSKLFHSVGEEKADFVYNKTQKGRGNPDHDFMLTLCEVDRLVPLEVVRREWLNNPVLYVPKGGEVQQGVCTPYLRIKQNILDIAY